MIEYVHDQGDFAVIYVDRKIVVKLCSDECDLKTALEVTRKLSAALGIPFKIRVDETVGDI